MRPRKCELREQIDRVDVIKRNVGNNKPGKADEVSVSDWQHILKVPVGRTCPNYVCQIKYRIDN